MYLLKKIWNPALYQGKYKKQDFFEGWYYKLIDSGRKNVLAVIPGVAHGHGEMGNHAFIQIINSISSSVHYFKFNLSEFHFSKDKFEVSIENNYFSRDKILLHLRDNLSVIEGNFSFYNIVPFPKTFFNPGIMGPYSFAPFMECYHGIVSIHHEIKGSISIDKNEIVFDGGYGYIEKDWGCSFPEAWVWIQSNHFTNNNVSFMFSIAKIPWLGRFFIGFISFLRLDDKLYRFATYTKSNIRSLDFRHETLNIIIEDKNYKLEIQASYKGGEMLKAPKNGIMSRDIRESINSVVDVKLQSWDGRLIFEDVGVNTGMEISGDMDIFIKTAKNKVGS